LNLAAGLVAITLTHAAAQDLTGVRSSDARSDASSVAALQSPASVDLDGRLDEPAWREAVQVPLTQQAPTPGGVTPFTTTVKALVYGNNLYIGFAADDPDPPRIAVHSKRRDGDVSGDDTVSIVLDPYGDRRTGYFFQTNAAAARIDGLIATFDMASLDWDGIWDVRTSRQETGWSAEFVIPVQSLTFTPGLTSWGINFERYVARERMTMRWTSPTLDSYIYDLSRAGTLTGTAMLAQGRGIEISPYVTGKTTKEFATDTREFPKDPGLDVAWRVTPRLATVFTINTDFAETEVDSRQLNVTRFPLFFPERRAFFLEGANQYDFSIGLDGGNFMPFFSRRIGLFDGQVVPIGVGAKLNGRVGRWTLGMLDVQTRDSDAAPGTNLFAGRASFDVTDEWRVGAVATHGDPGGVRDNSLIGIDSVWRTSTFQENKNLLFGTWFAMSEGDLGPGGRTGWGARLDYPNDLWDCRAETLQFGEAVDPALGFIRRPGAREYQTACSFKPRPSRTGAWSGIRQTFFTAGYNRVDDVATGVTESWSVPLTIAEVQLDSGDRFAFNVVPQGERLLEPFEISNGIELPIADHRFTRARVYAESGSQRPWVVNGSIEVGHFFSGTLLQRTGSIRWTSPAGTLETGVTFEQNTGDLAEGRFVQRLFQHNITYAFTPDLVVTSFLQYDNESRSLGNNARLRWTLKPGNDLFIVWNRGWRRVGLDPNDRSFEPDTELFAVKLRWTFRR
jgi:hypothetical protein